VLFQDNPPYSYAEEKHVQMIWTVSRANLSYGLLLNGAISPDLICLEAAWLNTVVLDVNKKFSSIFIGYLKLLATHAKHLGRWLVLTLAAI
jgi:hypothetical protein